MGMVLEPFIKHLGYGSYFLRPSPLCAFATVLCNTRRLHSVPVPRFFDVPRFFRNVLPLMGKLEQEQSIGLLLGARLKWILKKCPIKSPFLPKFPDILAHLSDASKQASTRAVVNGLQFILVHNSMDFACIDLLRRHQCAIMTPKSLDDPTLVSQCTGCI